MGRIAFGLSVVGAALSAGAAAAQNPGVGQLPPVGDLYGYSPLVQKIDPFPTRTSGYAHSMFLPGVGGRRLYPVLPPVVIHKVPAPAAPAVLVLPVEPTVPPAPVVRPLPARGWHRFGR